MSDETEDSRYDRATTLGQLWALINEAAAVLAQFGLEIPESQTRTIAAVQRIVGDHLNWLTEPESAAASGQTERFFTLRFHAWEQRGLARHEGGDRRLYLHAAVTAMAIERERQLPAGDAQPSYIYVVGNNRSGHVKIGVSTDPTKRISSLQTGHSDPLVVLAVFPGDVDAEAELHERFRSCRVRGEWFDPNPEMGDWLAGLARPTPLT